MSVVVLVGAQWGDEGKGKIIDFLSQNASVIVRHQGGNNAGHSLYIGNESFVLHLIPSGIVQPHAKCIIGHGVVIDPAVLWEEVEVLRSKSVEITPQRLLISGSAHVIMPYHMLLDGLQEASRGEKSIGTTKRGIGPAYSDKAARRGIRLWDLIDPERFRAKLEVLLPQVNANIENVFGGQAVDLEDIYSEYCDLAEKIKPFVGDIVPELNEAIVTGKNVLFEGAQGTLLDIDLGTYPYVTSSNTIAGGACTGAGFGPSYANEVIGVAKAYCTRVGGGPFPTELPEKEADIIRNAGPVGEFGATTGRPRRCGWLDLPLLRYSVAVNGLTSLALIRLDILSEVDTIEVAVAYELDGSQVAFPPGDMERIGDCRPVYKSLEGWKTDISGVTEFDQLPKQAQDYVRLIEQELGIPAALISVGPDRKQTIVMKSLFV